MMQPSENARGPGMVAAPSSPHSNARFRGGGVGGSHFAESMRPVVDDLRFVYSFPGITIDCLRHLIANRHRLTTRVYSTPDGERKCLFATLTEILPESEQILSKADLTRFFGRDTGHPAQGVHVPAWLSESYQPAKWLVRLIDRQFCLSVVERYGPECRQLTTDDLYDLAIAVAREVLDEREEIERLSARVEQQAREKLEQRRPAAEPLATG